MRPQAVHESSDILKVALAAGGERQSNYVAGISGADGGHAGAGAGGAERLTGVAAFRLPHKQRH